MPKAGIIGPFWLVLALTAALSGCDSRQGTAEASAERQPWANAQATESIAGDPQRGQQIAQDKCGPATALMGMAGPTPRLVRLKQNSNSKVQNTRTA